MTIRWILASLHLLALGVGLGGIVLRAASLRRPLDDAGIQRVLMADNAWGAAALLWISTGLVRAFGGFEKGTDYYLGSGAFQHKMLLLAVILALEVWPMITFIRWRISRAGGRAIDTTRGRLFSGISFVQAALVVLMVFAATATARGMAY